MKVKFAAKIAKVRNSKNINIGYEERIKMDNCDEKQDAIGGILLA